MVGLNEVKNYMGMVGKEAVIEEVYRWEGDRYVEVGKREIEVEGDPFKVAAEMQREYVRENFVGVEEGRVYVYNDPARKGEYFPGRLVTEEVAGMRKRGELLMADEAFERVGLDWERYVLDRELAFEDGDEEARERVKEMERRFYDVVEVLVVEVVELPRGIAVEFEEGENRGLVHCVDVDFPMTCGERVYRVKEGK